MYAHGGYASNISPNVLEVVRMAYALCYLPEDFVAMGIETINNLMQGNAFGRKLVAYLRSTWLKEKISVHNQLTRTTNCCETFYWRIQRVHDRMHNNINQFIKQLKEIESMCATLPYYAITPHRK